ncbi:MAG TPA: LamG-like jellyroll fold domain-containing protein [Bryobacteraceae bacterium]|nr:LamG-like jellyroll fold domain-containing protein [Bryobacteraceae bacterium]
MRAIALTVFVFAASAFPVAGQSGGHTLYNGIVLPQPFPPTQDPTQIYQIPSYITSPPPVIPIDIGRQLFVDDFLVQQTTMTRTQHQPVKYPFNPVVKPNAEDTAGFAMPFSDGVWFDPADHLFKMWLFCATGNAVCYSYSTDGKNWVRPSIPDAAVPNTDQVIVAAPGDPPLAGLIVWMDLQDPNPGRKFKAFASDATAFALLYFSPDGIHWTANIRSQYPIPIFDRTTFFLNPFRNVWVDSLKTYTPLPVAPSRPSYTSRARLYAESPDLSNWTPPQPGTSNFWTGPDVNDPPYVTGGTNPQLYNLDAVAYESVLVGLFSWFYPGFDDENPNNLPGPDIVELGAGFSRDGFQWVRPTRGSGSGTNGAFIPASNVAGTWDLGNTQSAGGCFLIVGDELWFYFSGRNARHGAPAVGATGLATLRRDGFYSMDAGSAPASLTTRPVQFSGKYLFVNVKDPQGSLQIQLINPTNGGVLATSLPLTADKTLQQVNWANGLTDLSLFANQPVQFQFTMTNGSLYSFWVSSSLSGASNGYVAANGPGFTSATDTVGAAGYPTTAATPEVNPAGGIITSSTPVTIVSRTLGTTVHYTLDGTVPTASSPVYTGPLTLFSPSTLNAVAFAPGLNNSAVGSATFTVDNTPPTVAITAPQPNQTLAAGITVTASASDSLVGIANVQFLVDGVNIATVSAAPYTITLQTTTLTNTTHVVTAIATNTLGTQATSAPVTIAVQNVSSGPTAGLAGYWSFDTAYVSGSTLFDQSGNNNPATAFNTSSITGQTGQALQFNGSSSYSQVTSSLSTQVFDLVSDLTLSLWIQTTNTSRLETLLSKYSGGGTGAGYILKTTPAGAVAFQLGGANLITGNPVVTGGSGINDGRWHHIAVVVRLGSTVSFYVDGVLSSLPTVFSASARANSLFQMGANPDPTLGANFTGSMDEVRIYDRALSSSEIASLSGSTGGTGGPSATAIFVKIDANAEGNWVGAYGQAGYAIAADATSVPSYASLTINGASLYTWFASTPDVRALIKASNPNDRIAATYYAAGGFTMDLNVSGGQAYPVAFYALDWDFGNRTETISILDANTSQLLDSRTVSGFTSGAYLIWNIAGHVTVKVTNSSGPNSVVSGIFFGPGASPDLAITSSHNGSFTQGDLARQYTLAVSNVGSAPTSGSVTVSDTLPSGLTAASIAGVGWTCTQPGGPCTRSDSVLPGASFPAITLAVNVAGNAPGAVTNVAVVSGVGDVNPQNNTANDLTTINLAGTAFVTGYGSNSPLLRNDFTGWVGMNILVGSNPLTVTALGRVCVSGNAGTHGIKLVSAATGLDVQGGSVSISMSNCTPGQIAYTALTSPVSLQANTAYSLVTQELNGGDKWYDFGAITTTSAAAVISSVYSSDGQNWIRAGNPNTSYVPPSFLYTVATPAQTTVQASPAAASFSVDGTSYSSSQVFTWNPGSSHVLSVTTPQAAGPGTQYVWLNWSDGGATSHTITAAGSASYTANFGTQYLLTTSVSPANGGSITINPTANAGYYVTGTLVQFTAVPASGCTFTGWGGDMAGTVNPQSLTISAPHSVIGNFQCSAPVTNAVFITAYSQSSAVLRNDFTGWVGTTFTVGGAPLSVTSLGRVCASGNAASHTVKIVHGTANGTDLAGASTAVTMAGCTPGQFVYASLASPVTLQAGTSYHLVTQELAGGDRWYDYGGVSVSSDAAILNSVFSPDSATWLPAGPANTSYVPANFQYSILPPPAPDLAIAVSHSGNFVQSDTGDTYTIMVTNAGTGSTSAAVQVSDTVPGGLSATAISGTGWICTQPSGPCSRTDALTAGGSYPPITLTVNVASNAPASVTNTASVSTTGDSNLSNNTASDTTTIQARVQVTVQASISGPSFTVDGTTYTSPQSFSWISGSSHTIAVTSPQSGGAGVQYAFSSWSDGGASSHAINPVSQTTITANFTVQYQLTTGVQPAPGGSVTASPVSNGGYYNSGTQVQLTAVPNSGYVFTGWSGDLSGNTNPQTISMTAAHGVNANFQQLTTGITAYTASAPLRNNFGGFVGTSLTIGPKPLSVVTLGRVCAPANAGVHTIKIVDASSGMDLPSASVSLSMAGCVSGQFIYAPLTSAVTLQPYASYLLVSQEVLGGDQWFDFAPISTTSDLAPTASVYYDGAKWVLVSSPGTSYVPPGFQYSVASANTSQPAITSFSKGAVRNDFTGWVGAAFTTGPAGLMVNALGRITVSGNAGTHLVKVVRASDGSDVPGASVSVNTGTGTTGQFVWTALSAPVTLPGNTSYYLVSLEQTGGDQWYDYTPVSSATSLAITSAVYSFEGKTWVPIGGPNMSYVPPNLK